jgi:proteasome assembly chaperone (PAC2) family protein
MGRVAMNAGYYLIAKLGMHIVAEFFPNGLFDVDYVEVEGGLIRPGHRPRSRFFVWIDPERKHDIVVFIGEAQPPLGKYTFCRRLVEYAHELGIERVFTFASMPTPMHPRRKSRVFCAATDAKGLQEAKRLGLEILRDGQIGGLNGVLLGVAAEIGLRGTCLLGEMPQMFVQFAFPKAALAVLEVFRRIAGIDLDVSGLSEQVEAMDLELGELTARMETLADEQIVAEEEGYAPKAAEEPRLSQVEEQRIDQLFEEAKTDRSKAYELKHELDRLDVFRDYEDRFLDLFKKRE